MSTPTKEIPVVLEPDKLYVPYNGNGKIFLYRSDNYGWMVS